MKSVAKLRREGRIKRHRRIRKRLAGSADRPRLCVRRSHLHIYSQIVDDDRRTTLAGAATTSPEVRVALKGMTKTEASRAAGKLIAARALAKGIKKVSFDRGGYLYHGRVKALAEGAREGGLEF